MKVIILLFKQWIHSFIRNIFWIYRLSQSNLGEGTKIEFPVIREGKGHLSLGARSFIGKRVRLGTGENASLEIGTNAKLEQDSVVLLNLNCNLTIGNNFNLGSNARLFVQNDWKFYDDTSIHSYCSIFSREPGLAGKFIMHNNSHIGDNCIIDVSDDIIIYENVAIGPNCTFYTHDHEYEDLNKAAWDGKTYTAKIIIGKDSWIGSNVTILPGVTIGNHVVVAAGSVVTKNLDDNSVYAGVPAKKIKTIE